MRGLKPHKAGSFANTTTSHLLQMRGLKQIIAYAFEGKISVASFTDAWIETSSYIVHSVMTLSHLLQMRGLKQNMQLAKYQNNWVASFTDAWIETVTGNDGRIRENRRIFYRCVD